MNPKVPSILIIYTGGTIGMIKSAETGSLMPFDFSQISNEMPVLKRFGYNIKTISFDPPIDSSNISLEIWVKIANLVKEKYDEFDGFVILHGTDTMSFTASALSFMLKNLGKPVILTGSQLPIGTHRTDGKENLITAIEIAAAQKDGKAIVPEVCILFESKLFRGNRTTKHNSEYFNAFRSPNYPILAKAGIHINYNYKAIKHKKDDAPLELNTKMSSHIAILKIFPGISLQSVKAILNIPDIEAVVFETYGSGNAPTEPEFLQILKEASDRGVIILNVTQCSAGSVDMSQYETGENLCKAVASGYDSTTESAVTKLMHVLGQDLTREEKLEQLSISLAGEITLPSYLQYNDHLKQLFGME